MSGIGKCYTIYREIASKKLQEENHDWVWEEKCWGIEKLEEKLLQENHDWAREKKCWDIEKMSRTKHLEVFLDIHYIKII